MNDQSVAISPLVADLITAQLRTTHAVTDQLIESLTYQLNEANARARAVEHGVLTLLEAPWMPTPATLVAALNPSAALIAAFRDPKESA